MCTLWEQILTTGLLHMMMYGFLYRFKQDGCSPRKIYFDLMPEQQLVQLYRNATVAAMLPLKPHQTARATYQVDDIQESPVNM